MGFSLILRAFFSFPNECQFIECQFWGKFRQTLRCILSNLEYRFYKAYRMEIEDKRTVFGECSYRLVPREDEPSVCLMRDWIELPSA